MHPKIGLLVCFCLVAIHSSAQNVGIGIDTPQTTLHVAGTTLTDSLTMPVGARDGYILKTDSLGHSYWAKVVESNFDPVRIDAFQFSGTQPEYIAIQGDYAFVASDNSDSLLVFDISNPPLVTKVGGTNIQFPSVAQGLVVNGNYAYADYGNRLIVYDISNPANPLFTDDLLASFEDLEFHNGYIYAVSNFLNGLLTINVQNPDSIFTGDTLVTGGDPNGIAIEDGYAYIIDAGTLDLKVIDLADAEHPAIAGAVSFGGFPTFIEVNDGFAYATDNSVDSLFIFDVRDPMNPSLISRVGGYALQSGLHTDSNLLLMSDSVLDSLYVFDITDPFDPMQLGAVQTHFTPTRMDYKDGYIYLLNESPDRIEVFQLNQLVATDINGQTAPFSGDLPGLVTIASINPLNHLRLNRIGVGGVHLTATDPAGFAVTDDNGQELLLINGTSGKVGIGTTNPPSELSVFDTDDTGDAAIFLKATNPSTREMLIAVNQVFGGTIGMSTNHPLRLITNDISRMTITSVGQVGIGTSLPSRELTVADVDLNGDAALNIVDGMHELFLGVNSSGASLRSLTNHDLSFWTNGIRHMTVDAGGNVGVGVVNPDANLHVDGADNDGVTAALKVQSGSQALLLDGNEIDATTSDLHLQNNSIKHVILANGGGKVGIGTDNPGAVVSSSRLDVSSGHILVDNNFGVFAAHSSGTGLGAGFDSGTGDELDIWAGGDHRMTLLANGNVGIGTTNPDRDLTVFDVDGGGSAVLNIKDATRELYLGVNSSDATIRTLTNHELSFWTNNSRRMTIGTDGNIGIGTSAPEHPLHVQKNGIADQQTIAMVLESAVSDRPILLFSENASSADLGAGMSIEYDGTGSGSTNLLRFNKTGGNAAMTIENGGEVGVNIGSPAATLHVLQLAADHKGLRLEHPTNTNYWDIGLEVFSDLEFWYNGFLKSYIDNLDGSYMQVSDIRLKKDIRPVQAILSKAVQLVPSTYLMKSAPDHRRSLGLIAQELEVHFPELVCQQGDYKTVNYSGVAVIAIQAIKEQQALIDQLQIQNLELLKRIEALEDK